MKSFDRYALTDTQIYDTTTGEIIDRDEIRLATQQKLKDDYKEAQRTLTDFGMSLGITLINDNHDKKFETVKLKENFTFNKILRVDVNYMFDNAKFSPESYAFIGRFSSSLHFPTNTVILHGESPTQEQMAEAISLGRTKLNKALKELEFYDVIKRKKVNGQTLVVFNPFLFNTGYTDINTYRLFRDSIYNPAKNNNTDVDDKNKEDEKPKRRKKSII